jgi:Family of unknown function (DUF6069)
MASPLDLKRVAKGAFLGGAIAGVICVALFFVGGAIGADFRPKDPAAMGGLEKLLFFQPMVNCLIAAAVSVGLLAVLNKVAPAKAWTIYLGVAAVVFLGEAYAPFWAFADMKTIAILELMHVPAAIGVIGGIHRFAIKA